VAPVASGLARILGVSPEAKPADHQGISLVLLLFGPMVALYGAHVVSL